MLELQNISKTFTLAGQDVRAVVDASLHLAAGDFVAVVGPSGCGKSTLLLVAGGLLAPDTGRVDLAGQNIYALGPEPRAALRAREIGFVFQRFHLVEYLSARENVLCAALGSGLASAEAARRADTWLSRLGMTDRAAHRPSELSTGERQRVALARAMLNNPRLILADEPTGNLDAENAAIVLDTLTAFADSGGAVLLVTHDPAATARAGRIIPMHAGRLAAPRPAPVTPA